MVGRNFLVLALILCVQSACSPLPGAKALVEASGVKAPVNRIVNRGIADESSAGAAAMAESPHETALKQLIRSSDFYENLRALENRESMDCMGARMSQVHWMCLNGPECGFRLDLTCVSRISTFGNNDRVTRLSYLGQTNAKTVEASFTSAVPEVSRFELKKVD